MGIDRARFLQELKKFQKVGLDSSILIYHLEDVAPFADFTEAIFGKVAEGSLTAVISTISLTELLVEPFRADRQDQIQAFENFLFSLPNTELKAPDYSISKEAARLRSRYKIRTPDALLISTAIAEKADAFITNDARLRILKPESISILILEDFLK